MPVKEPVPSKKVAEVANGKVAGDATRMLAFASKVIETAPVGILTYDATGQCVSANEAAAAVLGASVEQLLAQNFRRIDSWEGAGLIVAAEKTLATGRGRQVETHFTTTFGRDAWLDCRLEAFGTGGDRHLLVVVAGRTGRKQAEEALQSAKAFLAGVIDKIADPVFVKDDQRRFVLVNDALCAMVGRSREELLGRDGDDAFPADQVAVFREMDAGVLDTGEENVNEESLSDLSTGKVRTIVTRKTRYIDPAGKRFLIGLIRDITERMREQEALRSHVHEQSVRNDVAQIFLTTPGDDMYFEVLQVVLKVLQSPFGVFGFIDEQGALVVPTMTRQIWDKCNVPDKTITFPRATWGDSAWPTAIREKRSILSNEPSNKTPKGHVTVLRHICCPILFQDEVIGLLQVANKESDYTQADLRFLQTLVGLIAPVLDARLKRARQEEALEQARKLLEEAQGIARLGSWDWDAVKDAITGSAEFYRLFDVEPETIARFAQFVERLHPDDRERVQSDVADALRQDRPYDTDYRVKLRDGGWRDINARGRVFLDEQGKPCRLVGTCLDVTERKRTEAALQESETRFRTLLENLPQKIFMKDRRFRWVMINERFARDLGIRPVDVVGKVDSDLFPGELADKYRADDIRIVETGQSEELEEPYLEQGQERWVRTTKAPVRDGTGAVVGVCGVFSDITEHKRAEAALRRALADVERSNKELEQFAYVASHDLQEPLRMISSYTQLLAERYGDKLDDKAKKYIGYAVDGAIRLQAQINDLLTYSRVGTRGKPLEPTDSHAALGEAIRNLSSAIEESRALVVNDDLPTVRADAVQLALVFQNLIANAIKFHGEESPCVHVSARDQGTEWVFSVKDNGIGIDPKFAERLFVIFQRLHTREEYPGSGIGLAICKRIVERHGGRIWFESEPGKGSTFFFTVPK